MLMIYDSFTSFFDEESLIDVGVKLHKADVSSDLTETRLERDAKQGEHLRVA
jgi:hypothetical protein